MGRDNSLRLYSAYYLTWYLDDLFMRKIIQKDFKFKIQCIEKKRKVHVTDAWIKLKTKKKNQNFPIIDMKNVLLEFFLIKTIQSNQSNCVFPNVIMHCWFKKK